jgi:hypothetical protein
MKIFLSLFILKDLSRILGSKLNLDYARTNVVKKVHLPSSSSYISLARSKSMSVTNVRTLYVLVLGV